jgi:preprotein translocase subunit SecY
MALAPHHKSPTPSIHAKKRLGAHQRQTKPFMKTYWPYLPVFSIAAIAIVVVAARILGPAGAVLGSASLLVGTVGIIL